MKPLALSTIYATVTFDYDWSWRYAAERAIGVEISPRHCSKSFSDFRLLRMRSSSISRRPTRSAPAARQRQREPRVSRRSLSRAALDLLKSHLWALKAGAKKLCPPGQVRDVYEQFEQELEMRQMFDSGRASEPRFAELRAESIERRAKQAGPYVAAAKQSLHELVRLAEPHGIAIGLENRYHYHEIPGPDEYGELLDGLTNEQAGYWHDVGHAEVLHRLGFIDRHVWLDRWSSRCMCTLHDVSGIVDTDLVRRQRRDYWFAGVQTFSRSRSNQPAQPTKGSRAVGFLREIGWSMLLTTGHDLPPTPASRRVERLMNR